MKLLTVDEVAKIIRKKSETIYKDRIRRPNSVPPFFTQPGCRQLVCEEDVLISWIRGELPQKSTSTLHAKTNKRGRPSHASNIAAAKAEASHV